MKLNKEEMINDLKKSFNAERIILDQVDDKFVVSQNGCHRTSILKFLYIDEVLKGNTPLEELNEKYKIKARVDKYDMTLTYTNYLLNNMKIVNRIEKDYDDNYKETNKFIVKYNNDQPKLLSKEEIMNSFGEIINQNESNMDEYLLNDIKRLSKVIPSFNDFLKEYAPTLIKEEKYGSLS